MSARSATARLRDESGAALLLVAASLTVLILFLMFVVEVGNWSEHKRHLQTQVDAAALAGAGSWQQCFDGDGYRPLMEDATAYAGAPAKYAPTGDTFSNWTWNAQVGAPDANPDHTVSVLYQSDKWADGRVDTDPPPATDPCSNPYVFDVKATESWLPLFFKEFIPGFSAVRSIDAAARVQLFRVMEGKAGLPLAIPVPDPKTAPLVTVVNEATGATWTFRPTTKSVADGVTNWTGNVTVDVSAGGRLGIRVGTIAPDLATIRGFDPGATGSPAVPVVRDVWPMTCSTSPFFSDLDTSTNTCAAGVAAIVDFGSTADPALEQVRATVTAASGGKSVVALTRDSGSFWRTDPWPLSIDVGTGQHDVTLESKYGTGSWKPLADGQVLHSIYSTDDQSQGVARIAVASDGGNLGAPWALPAGTHTLTVTIGMRAFSLNRLVSLRLTGTSRTTAVNCDGTGNADFTTALLGGCQTTYQVNVAGTCPDAVVPNPPDCLPLKTGNLGTTVTRALNTRFASCPANNWPDYEDSDPRIVQLWLTDFSAAGGSGATAVPVTGFARFYLAGWSGNPCGDAWPFPYAEPNGGNLWGYFIKEVDPKAEPGTEVCSGDQLDPCAPKLTR